MARPPDSQALRALKTARKTLAKIEALNPNVQPAWREGMLAHWRQQVEELTAVVRAEGRHRF